MPACTQGRLKASADGWFQERAGQSTCGLCGAHYACTGGVQTLCADGTYTNTTRGVDIAVRG